MPLETEPTNLEKIRCCEAIIHEIQQEHQRPVCPLTFRQAPFSLTDSHLGGVPYLPHGQAYPMGADGQTLWLCAQINFAQMPPMDGFPREGILQFFLSDWHYDGGFGLYSEDFAALTQHQWRILYHPSIDETVTLEACQAKMPCSWEEASDLWRTPTEPLRMEFLPVTQEGISDSENLFRTLFAKALSTRLPGADPEDYLPYALWGETPEEEAILRTLRAQCNIGGCKIGGSPRYEQDDPREYSQESGKALEEWDTLLFQLDDDTFTFPAGDEIDLDLNGGTLNFLIRSEDLRRRDFSQVLAQWSCS